MGNKLEVFYTMTKEEEEYRRAYLEKERTIPELPVQLRDKVMADLRVTLPAKYYLSVGMLPARLMKHPCYMPEYLHSHEFVEIIYVLSGRNVRQNVEGGLFVMGKGDLLLINPGHYHSIGVFEDGAVVLDLLVENRLFADVCGNLGDTFITNKKFMLVHDDGPGVADTLERILAEQEDPDGYSVHMLGLLLSGMVVHIRRSCAVLRVGNRQEGDEAYRLLEYIGRNYRTCDLGALAEHFGISGQYASRLIKEKLGENYSGLVKRFRMEASAALLRGGKMSCKEIAYEVGYFSQEHFTRIFRSYFGRSPGEYRKEAQSM